MPTDSQYQRALDYIYSFIDHERVRGPRVRHTFDLRRMDELLGRLGDPHLKARTAHIAGSKGKGSVAAMTASALTAAGRRTGLYTSPHLHVVNERVRLDGEMIPNDELVRLVERLRPEVEAVNRAQRYGRLTTFEVLTALGFACFADHAVDYQVIEVGLGGRLDATNVVRPAVCVITSLSLEHTDILGDRLELIAAEKAGIIKPGSTVVSAPQAEGAARVIADVCRRQGARLVRVGEDVTWQGARSAGEHQALVVRGRLGCYELVLPLLGRYQLDNAAVAVAALEVLAERDPAITPGAIRRGIAGTRWEGRLQVLGRSPLVVADGAHNVDSLRRLVESLRLYFDYDRSVLIFGLSADKDLAGMVATVVPHFDRFIVTRSIHPRSMPPGPIAAEFARHGVTAGVTGDISEALPLALEGLGERDLVCVSGSLFVVAGAIEQAPLLGLRA